MKVQEALKAAIEALEDTYGLNSTDTIKLCKAALSEIGECEPVGWQFYQDGKWHNGMDTNNHKQNTIDAGFPIRELYTSPQPIEKCEPVAYNHHFIYDDDFMPELVLSHSKEIPAVSGMKYAGKTDELYDKPQPREWVGLSDDDINELQLSCLARSRKDLVKQADEKLKQLNTKG